ncbi:hypothetical protein V1478_008852 [Vespula squamosa]|uniref:Uncharacterized protein n=1 Tax=Vespula squamosa TaxID=30214 RepID=A0ABD2AUP0_VESSQ
MVLLRYRRYVRENVTSCFLMKKLGPFTDKGLTVLILKTNSSLVDTSIVDSLRPELWDVLRIQCQM